VLGGFENFPGETATAKARTRKKLEQNRRDQQTSIGSNEATVESDHLYKPLQTARALPFFAQVPLLIGYRRLRGEIPRRDKEDVECLPFARLPRLRRLRHTVSPIRLPSLQAR
jgi:hypothetical protein